MMVPVTFTWARRVGRNEKGFTLLEMMTVVVIAGILATLAEPTFQGAVLRAREAVLKQDLFTLREAIDQYRADKGQYPPSLIELKGAGYVKRMPVDPFTKSDTDWQEIAGQSEPGIFDVHSGSDLVSHDGTPYNTW
jgi:general secretion pathway protein G